MKGLNKFREHFAGLEGHYVLIGGSACFIIMDEAGIDFRATRDLDIVLCVEALDDDFTTRFWEFVKAGGYEQREKTEGHKEFYRFCKPKDDDFPFMLELFSRKPGQINFTGDGAITPIPAGQDVDSLSAIILNDEYYDALVKAARVIDGVRVLDERLLIPFKAKAFLDLSERKQKGESVSSKDVRKHRNDVFRLLQLLGGDEEVDLTDALRQDMAQFAGAVEADESFQPDSIGLEGSRADQVGRLRKAYSC